MFHFYYPSTTNYTNLNEIGSYLLNRINGIIVLKTIISILFKIENVKVKFLKKKCMNNYKLAINSEWRIMINDIGSRQECQCVLLEKGGRWGDEK